MGYRDVYLPSIGRQRNERLFRYDAERAIIQIRRRGTTYVVDLTSGHVQVEERQPPAAAAEPHDDQTCAGR